MKCPCGTEMIVSHINRWVCPKCGNIGGRVKKPMSKLEILRAQLAEKDKEIALMKKQLDEWAPLMYAHGFIKGQPLGDNEFLRGA